MGKYKGVSDRGQIVMARTLGQNISRTAGLVEGNHYAAFSLYLK